MDSRSLFELRKDRRQHRLKVGSGSYSQRRLRADRRKKNQSAKSNEQAFGNLRKHSASLNLHLKAKFCPR
jgi:hypothetical protein